MVNKEFFFSEIKKQGLFTKLSQAQVDSLSIIVDTWDASGHTDLRWLAYEFATIYHETGAKMLPVKEYGGEKYLRSKPYYPYYGRDFCQTTWKYNYEKVRDFTGVDVVSNPDLIGNVEMSAKVALHFMVNGLYTGKKLASYFNAAIEDPVNARRVINGKDKANKIAGYYRLFLSCLQTKNS